MQDREILATDGLWFPMQKTDSSLGGEPTYLIHGIASDEETDLSQDADRILRKHLDITYAQKHGYVNWNHSDHPSDQLGILTQVHIIAPHEIQKYSDICGRQLRDTASLYTQAALYKNVKKVKDVIDVLESARDENFERSLSYSIEGRCKRNDDDKLVKAFVQGVAITHGPANQNTFCMLVKALLKSDVFDDLGDVQSNDSRGDLMLNYAEAVYQVMKLRPYIDVSAAEMLVDYCLQQKEVA